MPTVTVVASRGGSPSCSVGSRSAVVLARIAGRLGKLLGPQAIAIEARVRSPPNLVVLVT